MTEQRYLVMRLEDYHGDGLEPLPKAEVEFSVIVSEFIGDDNDPGDTERCRARIYKNHWEMFTWVSRNLPNSSACYEQHWHDGNWSVWRAMVYFGSASEASAFRLRWS